MSFKKVLGGLKTVAPIAANLVVPGSGALVSGLMRAITGDGPDVPIDDVAAKLEANPELYLQFKTALLAQETELAQIAAERLATVNQTMQTEAKSEHWVQFSWRPFTGFLFPITTIGVYVLLPILGVPVPDVPDTLWMGWLAILGVATYDRGKEKREQQPGHPAVGLLGQVIGAIKKP